jgi:hypothetical protein
MMTWQVLRHPQRRQCAAAAQCASNADPHCRKILIGVTSDLVNPTSIQGGLAITPETKSGKR